jgi:hypothetical protein
MPRGNGFKVNWVRFSGLWPIGLSGELVTVVPTVCDRLLKALVVSQVETATAFHRRYDHLAFALCVSFGSLPIA